MADLDAVVVGCGPGPFTGLRAGMATAAAYGHALDIPVHGVCSLDAIGVRTTGDTLVVTDARRREVYWARYRDGVRTDGPAVNAPADVDPGSARAVAGSPEHAALFGLPRVRAGLPDGGRPGRRGGRLVRQPGAAGGAVSAPARRQALGGPRMTACREPVTIGALTPADAERCAELEAQLFDGDDPVAGGGVQPRTGQPPQPLRGRAHRTTCWSATPGSRGWAATAVRVRGAHHRRGPGIPGAGYRPPAARRAAGLRRRRRRLPGGPHRQRGGDRAVPQRRDSRRSACAGATTGSAAPTPTRCGGRR